MIPFVLKLQSLSPEFRTLKFETSDERLLSNIIIFHLRTILISGGSSISNCMKPGFVFQKQLLQNTTTEALALLLQKNTFF